MCLYPKIMKNKKYTPNKKNGGNVPVPFDRRVLAVPIKCGECIECRKAMAREWKIRLHEELVNNKDTPIFITLTFSEESITEIKEKYKLKEHNEIASKAVRLWTENYRINYGNKKALRHWLIPELGHQNTKRLHLHGIIWTKLNDNEIEKSWGRGWIFAGRDVTLKTINYIVKYITKIDPEHPEFRGKIMASKGIGKGYEKGWNAQQNRYKEGKTNEMYTLSNGIKIPMPIYYRNKIYSEEEREKLWIEKLNKAERYVNGMRIRNVDTRKGNEEYSKALEYAQKNNIRMGYGKPKKWSKREYDNERYEGGI